MADDKYKAGDLIEFPTGANPEYTALTIEKFIASLFK